MARVDLQPVILGGDIGVYALARSFHEVFRVRSHVVSASPIRAITSSRIATTVPVEHPATAEAHLDALLALARRHRRDHAARGVDVHLLLMANTDWFIRLAVTHRAALEEAGYIVPFLDADTLATVSDKDSFARVCAEQGVPTPRTVVADFAAADDAAWAPPHVDLTFPIIAKPSSSAAYNDVRFEGKKKVYHVADAAELARLWETLRAAGFRDRFLAQELIPGDDTQMRSITAYVDSTGEVSLLGTAHVLLEDHAPTMLGNPVAMITGRDDTLTEPARRFLDAVDYRGFANFDVKIDPRDGTAHFFEVNPRIGRNSYYMTAAGLNPMRWLVADHVDHEPLAPAVLEREVLYSLVPKRLLTRYVREPALAQRVERLYEEARVADPLEYRNDRSPARVAAVLATKYNHFRKFGRHYPVPTDSSF